MTPASSGSGDGGGFGYWAWLALVSWVVLAMFALIAWRRRRRRHDAG